MHACHLSGHGHLHLQTHTHTMTQFHQASSSLPHPILSHQQSRRTSLSASITTFYQWQRQQHHHHYCPLFNWPVHWYQFFLHFYLLLPLSLSLISVIYCVYNLFCYFFLLLSSFLTASTYCHYLYNAPIYQSSAHMLSPQASNRV